MEKLRTASVLCFCCLAALVVGSIIASARPCSRLIQISQQYSETMLNRPVTNDLILEHGLLRGGRRRLEITTDQFPTRSPNELSWYTFPPTPTPPPKSINGSQAPPPSERIVGTDATVPAVMVGVASVVIVCAVLLYVNDLRDRCRHDQMLQEDQRQRRPDLDSHKQMETIASSSGFFHNEQPDFVEDLSISHVSTMTFSLADGLRLADSDGEELESSLYVTELNDTHRVSQDTDLSSLIDLSLIKTMTPLDDSEDEDEDKENGYETPEKSITTFDQDDDEDYSVGPDPISTFGEDSDSDSEDYDDGESGWSSPDRCDVSSDESSIETFLTNHVSRAGSKDDASSYSSVDTPQLLGEQCLEVTPQREGEDPTSFELSPDTSYSETSSTSERSRVSHKTPPRLDQFFLGKSTANGNIVLPVQEYTKPSPHNGEDDQDSYVRDIYFVPVAANTVLDLGIQLHDPSCTSTHPMIASVQKSSPLAGRLFEGDILLAVNNVETTGLCGDEVSKSFSESGGVQEPGDDDESTPSQARVVKLTIMSSQSDGSDSSTSSSSTTMPRSVDTGRSETAVEV